MENIQRVTSHLAAKVSAEPDRDRLVLTLVPARDEKAWYVDADGNHWRAYRFIEQAHALMLSSPRIKHFRQPKHLDSSRNCSYIFHHLHCMKPSWTSTTRRNVSWHWSMQSLPTPQSARSSAKQEIEFAFKRKSIASVLLDANLPQRIAHNDTKFNNVLLDDVTAEGICVIDLDTVMPGSVLHDFGDMVRTTTSPAQEDERDLSKVTMQFSMFEALVHGYLASTGSFLTTAEKEHLVSSAKLMTLEQGIRFLTDYLAGDVYYKVRRDKHNLDRCRTQFKLLESDRTPGRKNGSVSVHRKVI